MMMNPVVEDKTQKQKNKSLYQLIKDDKEQYTLGKKRYRTYFKSKIR